MRGARCGSAAVPEVVQLLQLLSGAAWLVPALYLSRRIGRAWRADASRATMLAAPIGFLCWLQVGFVIRWLLWPHAIGDMSGEELATWGALYALSALLAVWVFSGARSTRND